MVAPGNVNPTGVRVPPPPWQGKQLIKVASESSPSVGQQGSGGGYQGTPRTASMTQHSTEVFHQRRKLPFFPARMALCGFVGVVALGCVTLYLKKKPEATAMDVAKVAIGTASTENTKPRN